MFSLIKYELRVSEAKPYLIFEAVHIVCLDTKLNIYVIFKSKTCNPYNIICEQLLSSVQCSVVN